MGSDIMLDILSKGDDHVKLEMNTEPFDHTLELSFQREESEGGMYLVNGDDIE